MIANDSRMPVGYIGAVSYARQKEVKMDKQKSLRQQARELQISPSYLSMILSGQRQPNPGLNDRLCSLGMFTTEAVDNLGSKHSTAELHPQLTIYIIKWNEH